MFLVVRFNFGNTHQFNAVLGHGNDFETQSVKLHRFAHRRHLAVVGQQEPRQSGEVRRRTDQIVAVQRLLQ
ncbi:hypothetical protein D3C81_1608450 [compost metagenome]